MDLEFIEGVAKVFYMFTIPWLFTVWLKAFRHKHLNHFVRIVFWVQCLLFPMFTAFALMNIFEVAYGSAFGYLGWAIINMLFIATDLMLVNTVIYADKLKKCNCKENTDGRNN